jgi:hypothetical protein
VRQTHLRLLAENLIIRILSNALTLEELTSKHRSVGHLLTFFQFLVVAIHGLPKHLTVTRWRGIPIPKLKPRQVPLRVYIVQVILFCLLSILNNKAFSYYVPMPVHIIFRSGGLATSMLMGRILLGRRLAVLREFELRRSPIFQIYDSTSCIRDPRDAGSYLHHSLRHKETYDWY